MFVLKNDKERERKAIKIKEKDQDDEEDDLDMRQSKQSQGFFLVDWSNKKSQVDFMDDKEDGGVIMIMMTMVMWW